MNISRINKFFPSLVFLLVCLMSYDYSSCSPIRPNTLERIPLLTLSESIWELTTVEAINRTGYKIMDYPSGLDVKKISGTYLSLTVLADASWCNLIFIKTNWIDFNQEMASEIRGLGKWGTGENRFKFPVGVEIGGYDGLFDPEQDHIYVSDTGNKRIVRLGYDPEFNNPIWDYDFGDSYLSNPQWLAYFDKGTETRADDEVIVADIDPPQLARFSIGGQFLGSYNESGHGPGQLSTPIGICKGRAGTDWEDHFYVTDTYNYKVCQFQFDGNGLAFVNETYFDQYPQSELIGITTDYEGMVYVADWTRNRILKLSPNLDLIAVIDENAGSDFTFNEPLVVRFYDGALTVVNRYCETSGFMCFGVPYLDTLKWDEDWYGDISLQEDILIPCGKSLDLKAGTHIRVASLNDEHNLGNDPNRVEIIVEGTFNSLGNIHGTSSDSVLIFSDGSPPERGDWYGIRVQEPCGLANVEYTSIRDAEYGLELYDATIDPVNIWGYVRHSQIDNNATAGIYSDGGILNLEKSSIKDNSIYGLYGKKSVADIYQNEFLRNARYGIWLNLASDPPDSIRITENFIDGEYGATTLNGLYLGHPQARVEGNHIRDYASAAVMISGSNSPILRLDTLTNRIGIDCQKGGSPTIRYCRIYHDFLTVGVNAGNGSFPHLGNVIDRGNNSVIMGSGISGRYIVNANLTTIYAQYNWWGTVNPPLWGFEGPVLYSPWLLGEPPPPRGEPESSAQPPTRFSVSRNYPNPFNPITRIDYSIPSAGHIVVQVYNVLGQLIKVVEDRPVEAGYHQLSWDATSSDGRSVGSGVYFISIRYNRFSQTQKILLLR